MSIVGSRAATAPLIAQDQRASATILPALTAAERGAEWTAKYGCTPICVMNHTEPDNNPGWHQGPAARCDTPASLVCDWDGDTGEPLLAARVTTVNGTPEVFGITTRLWVDIAGDTMELSVTEVDQFIAGLEGFLPQLRALRAQLAEATKGDIPENTEAKIRWHAEQNTRAAREWAEANPGHEPSLISEAEVARDREINEEVTRRCPDIARVTTRPTSQCTFEGGPAVVVRTGKLGNRYGLCVDCARTMDIKWVGEAVTA
ncbi:DUF6907 domain-containing protein [Streptomyces sp. NBC_01477]|uniref:DUF6907 domain-containing protein n=1 Tax=Streptomyces sp. NBC_01477 TaxID=2976015 RepID=UPI002E34DC62|nr:hypothetical protein [Streptomyces sp. NBC_01477]